LARDTVMPDRSLSAAEFRRRFRWLIFHTWNIPPIFGLGFILLIGVLTPAQVLGILTTPLEPAYILGWLAFAVWYLPRKMQPLADWLDGRPGSDLQRAVDAVRRFPVYFWATFLVYLVFAPVSVVIAAQLYTDFVATPIDLFRIELVALIVSIIVGLPIFFLVFDLFGKALGSVTLTRPVFTIRTKVILIGALIPLLIDTMLVQYYWTRTGYFSLETFVVWLLLELIAIGGSLVFAHSFGQALAPLQGYLAADRSMPAAGAGDLAARSTDELGVLTGDYRVLLSSLQLHGEILDINNQLLRRTGAAAGVEAAFTAVVELCQQAIRCDLAFLIVHDPVSNELVSMAQTGDGYRAEGHFRLQRGEVSLAVWAFNHRQTVAVEDTTHDPRVSPRMRDRFGALASLATPLWLDGDVQGVLMVIDRRQRSYVQREIALIEGLAREAALTLQTQRLRQARQKAEAERQEQAEQVRLLMDATAEGIYGADVNGACTFINRAALRMLGYARPEDLLGRNFHALVHHTYPDGRPYPKEQCKVRHSTVEGLPSHADDEVHWRADGTSFPVEYWSHPMYRDGKLVGAVVTFVDITERRKAEEQIRRINMELEARVAQRTAELQAARDVAEQASHAKTDFLSRMSHELRTPLNAILGFAQILRMRSEVATAVQRDEQVGQIEKAGWHLLELINEVLDLSRIESGTMAVGREAVELQRLCAECVQLVQPLAHSAGIEVFDLTTESEPLSALADRTRLNQVLMNLLSNAVKYNRRGGSVTLSLRATGDERVELSVADTGPGFTTQQLSNLYQPFNRLGAEGGQTEGTGIGLVITRRLTELMGGTLELDTLEGEGSRFTLCLARARPAADAGRPVPAAAPAAAAPSGATHTVLYIEDNPSNVDLVRSVLALRPGLTLATAPDGPTGLVVADTVRPGLIVIDIALPGIDGYEVCRRLRARAGTATTPIIALSANAMQVDIERGRHAGFDAYLTKPLDVQAFLAQLDRLLD
jgi:PAS domain S-box-containing protein